MNSYFVIVSLQDDLLFELESFKPDYYTTFNVNEGHHQFVAYAALDMVELCIKTASSPFLGIVDRAIGPDARTEWSVSAFVTPSGLRMLLLAEGRPEESTTKALFTECHAALYKILMNPFYEHSDPIRSKWFTEKVRTAIKKHIA